MKKIVMNKIDETIYYEKLENGMDVYLYSKDNWNNNYVTFTTKFGSIYNEFVPIDNDKMIKVPYGVAHFLEHKVFAQKEEPQPETFLLLVVLSAMPILHSKIPHIYFLVLMN